MPVEDQHRLALAARLHDVGTVAVPDRLLLKGGVLDEHELWVMQSHCQAGYEILSGSSSPVLQLAAEIALTHHEWFDGCGYPRGLSGSDIPLVGRIAAIADVFDALTSERPYRAPLAAGGRDRASWRASAGRTSTPSCSTCSSAPPQLRELEELAAYRVVEYRRTKPDTRAQLR